MIDSSADLLPAQIGRYQIKALLGRGGMAIVYLAFDPYMERRVAVKALLKDRQYDEGLRSRFKRESRMVASLNHPAIVPVYDFGEEDEQPYLVMRYMEGGSLRERLRHAPLSLIEVATILNRIAPALDTTHAHNIIHRDLKPSNILFDNDGKAYLADFGLAKFAEGTYTTLTRNEGMVGTPAYMSPEQIRGQEHLDGRTDIYSLGVILFEMLAGRLPFAADSRFPIALMHLSDPVPDVYIYNPILPKEISQIVIRAMAKSREERFATASALTAPFVEAAQIDPLPPVEFPNAPPIILEPDSESSSSVVSSIGTESDKPDAAVLPGWLQSWLSNYGTKQDIGRSRLRGTLEDRLRVGYVQTGGGLPLLLAMVSDGGSSQQHGHLAAELAINELFNRIELAPTAVPDEIPEMLHKALQQTNRTLFAVSRQHRTPLVMQSMVAIVAIHENRLYVAHVGHGHIYLLRHNRLHQLSRSTPVPPVSANSTAPDGRSQSGNPSSAIGLQPELHVDLGLYLNSGEDETAARQNQGLLLHSNDRLLLCTDGLLAPNAGGWQRRRLRRVMAENPPAEAAKILVQDALNRSVPDNVTAVVLQAPGTVPHVPLYKTRPFRVVTGFFFAVFLVVVLLMIGSRPGPPGVFVEPGMATEIAQIIDGLTATAVTVANNPGLGVPTAVPPLIAPAEAPQPGFAVIFAAGEGAMFRSSGQSDWRMARAGDLVQIGANAAIQSGSDRMGVVLSDGAELYLAPQAELLLSQVNQTGLENETTRVDLVNGRLLIHYKNADPHDFELTAPSQAKVLFETGQNVVGVIYEVDTAVLEMDCFGGVCRLRNDLNRQLRLQAGQYGFVSDSSMATNSTTRPSLYCDLAPALVACPTPTPAPTQTLAPIVQTVIAATETAVAQTATTLPSLTPSNTPSSTPSPSVTPLPTITPLPNATTTSPAGQTNTPAPPATSPPATATKPPTPAPTATSRPPTLTPTPLPPTATPKPSNTPQPPPFTATPLPTFTPTVNPNT
ncbi:MAG: protein kinase [Anaerolineaceae bacterium]|nr:protein kinase [Anaerolineaceae bacterium]